MGVADVFAKFLINEVNLDPGECKTAKSSMEWLVTVLEGFSNKNNFPEAYTERHIQFGSFSRKTKIRPLDDIDIMFCMNADGCTYAETDQRIEITVPEGANRFRSYTDDGTNILNSRKVINAFIGRLGEIWHYRNAEIKRNQEAAVLNLSSYDWSFDIVPCFFSSPDTFGKTFYIIPDGQGCWKRTDPRLDRDRLSTLNLIHSGKILETIRMMKFWNARQTMPTISSYLIETIIINCYDMKTSPASNFRQVEFLGALNFMKDAVFQSVGDPKGIQGDLNTASPIDRLKISWRAQADAKKTDEAIELEIHQKEVDALQIWSSIFGPRFEKYK
jgi:hypothetical protein